MRMLNEKHKKSKMEENQLAMSGEFGFLTTSGNTKTSVLKMALDTQHELKSWSNQYSFQALRRASEVKGDSVENNRMQLSTQLDYKLLKDTNRLFVYAEYDDNEFLRLRDQITAVFGWRQIAWKKEKSSFGYSVGPGYVAFRRGNTGESFYDFIVRTTADFSYQFKNNAKFRHNLSAEMSEENTKARSVTSVTAKVFEKLAMKLSFEMTLDENVSVNVDEFTTQTSVSLVYQFF
ncbi:hypothetical protein GCM10007852_19450 [Agaribacter marinus]|uniref:DUF481 domain-containing protein n=2 Tax=Agaribacter marinus TaxID=1431249 RepID=A0AA37SWT0_9ALTE|nr:hypothetical protein GCM10007852_19450 [Agaribacter marinus]